MLRFNRCYCAHCGTAKFGLIRYTHFSRTYCSKKCKNEYYQKRDQEARQQKAFLHWLARPG